MGYGRAGSIQRTSATGDAGIDGIVGQDPLGLDRMQAKRYATDRTVDRPTIHEFAGALLPRCPFGDLSRGVNSLMIAHARDEALLNAEQQQIAHYLRDVTICELQIAATSRTCKPRIRAGRRHNRSQSGRKRPQPPTTAPEPAESRFRPRPTRRCPKSAPAIHGPDAARPTHGCSWCRLREASTTANARSASASNGRANGHRHRQQARSRRRARPHREEPCCGERQIPRPVGTDRRSGRKRDRPGGRTPRTAPPQVLLRTVRGHLGRGVQPRTAASATI